MKYIYPPRPETKIPPESLDMFEKMSKYMAEPKLNGSSMEIYTDGKSITLMNRHNNTIECKMDMPELLRLHSGDGEMILCGEYLNKNQKDETCNYWNHKYVVWDIIKYNGVHLLGTTFKERNELLRKLFPDNPVKKHIHQISENCFRVNAIETDFLKVYNDITKYDIYEGLVMKRMNGKLENGTTEHNNVKTQIKCRKATKNYNF
jgi:ATP-dependent DNA ligase